MAAALVLLLAVGLLDGGLVDFEVALAAELLLASTERLAEGELLVLDIVGKVLDAVRSGEDKEEPEEPLLEQALSPTRPHAATATTLNRRA